MYVLWGSFAGVESLSSDVQVRVSVTNYGKLSALYRELEEVTGKRFSLNDVLSIVLLGSGLT